MPKRTRLFSASSTMAVCSICVVTILSSSAAAQSSCELGNIQELHGMGGSFGSKVATDGHRAIITARRDGYIGSFWIGSVYIFRRDDNGTLLDSSDDIWIEETKLIPTEPGGVYSVGKQVAIDGDVVVIWANEFESQTPRAYIFHHDDNNTPELSSDDSWIQIGKLPLASNGFIHRSTSMTLKDNRIVVSASPTNASPDTEIYLYQRDYKGTLNNSLDDEWLLEDTITVENVTFFNDVDIEGNFIVAGYYQDDTAGNNAGAVFIFRKLDNNTPENTEDDEWVIVQQLIGSSTVAGSNFGVSVAISGNQIVVGEDDFAYVFEKQCNDWIEVMKINSLSLPRDPSYPISAYRLSNTRVSADGDYFSVYNILYRHIGSRRSVVGYVPLDDDRDAGSGFPMINNGVFVVGTPDENAAYITIVPEISEANDCNGNFIVDECDYDCNENGIPDDCEGIDPAELDCNGNHVPDLCELQTDCNNNDISDLCELADGVLSDVDNDGYPDSCPCSGPTVSIQPIGATGDYAIQGNEIFVNPGERVFLEVILCGWNLELLNNTRLLEYDISQQFGPSLRFDPALDQCSTNEYCENAFGTGSICEVPSFSTNKYCQYGYIDRTRADWVYSNCGGNVTTNVELGISTISLVSSSASACFGAIDPRQERYAASMVLDVPSWFTDSQQIRSNEHTTNMIDNQGNSIPFTFVPATITVQQGCCLGNGSCITDSVVSCNNSGGTIVHKCLGDCDGNGINDACESEFTDCNRNGRLDLCDILENTSLDCSGNLIPDECELDCNQNNLADSCDIFEGLSVDCNYNQVPDECDIRELDSQDSNYDGIPDECGIEYNVSDCSDSLNRYLYYQDDALLAGPNLKAIRITLSSVNGFGQFDGQVRWLGPPQEFTESGTATFFASQLQCEPYFADWSSSPQVYGYGSDVVPDSIYDIQVVDQTCADLNDPLCYSSSQMITTAKWGDVVAPFSATGLQQPDIADVLALVDKWLGSTSISQARGQLQADVPNPAQAVSIADILKAVDAWLGTAYPFDGPQTCSP